MGEHVVHPSADGAYRAGDGGALSLERAPGGEQDHLGIARGAVALHPELVDGHAAAVEHHALRVPERGDGVDLALDQAGNGGEAYRDLLDPAQVGAVPVKDRAEDGDV